MHCQWRLYRPFIMKCAAELGNDQIKEDPGVSDYNVHRFFLLNILMPAAMEYVVEISGSPGADDLDDPVPIMAKAKANVNFDWLLHFLHDCAFFTLDFLQSIRGNDSAKIDILWREFFSSAHTDTANKTQYTGMAIMRVFWGMGLVPDLDALYHAIRTIPSGEHLGCGVGWDWAIEMLNGAIKKHVGAHVIARRRSASLSRAGRASRRCRSTCARCWPRARLKSTGVGGTCELTSTCSRLSSVTRSARLGRRRSSQTRRPASCGGRRATR